jgi:hypothetical protein
MLYYPTNEEEAMEIILDEKFQELKNIITNVSKFYFGLKKEYNGPVNPSAIVSFGSKAFHVNVLIIAERVPALYLPFALDENHFEAVTVYLKDNFDFQEYHPQINELLGLSLLVGDPEYLYDGTIQGAGEFFRSKGWDFKVLYEAP